MWEAFEYTMEEQRIFPYVERYMAKIEPCREEIEQNPSKMRKFMLAGLFLEYRNHNYLGSELTTLNLDDGFRDSPKLNYFRQTTGEEILNTRGYLQEIGLTHWKYFLISVRILSVDDFFV